jgi:hypothetical protein
MSRPEVIDERGTVHRFGCDEPGWTTAPARGLTGWQLARCEGCGAARLERTARTREDSEAS